VRELQSVVLLVGLILLPELVAWALLGTARRVLRATALTVVADVLPPARAIPGPGDRRARLAAGRALGAAMRVGFDCARFAAAGAASLLALAAVGAGVWALMWLLNPS